MIRRNDAIVPIEVKSSENVKSKSLKVYMDKYKPDYAIKITAKNLDLKKERRAFLYMQCFAYSNDILSK